MTARWFRGFSHITRRLFFKIFLAFWLAMAVAGAILLAVETTRNAQMAERWRGVTGDAFAVYAASAAQDYPNPHNAKAHSLNEFLADLEKRTSIRAWVFDATGNEVSGYAAAPRRLHPLWLRERMTQLVQVARASGQSEFADLEGITLAARAAPASNGQILVLVGTLQDARYDFWGAAPRVQILRLLAILATAGFVSWILALHLTHPLDNLSVLTRRLAAGDFSARADARLDRRRDELAADFNSMAARIERLLREQERLLAAQRHLLADVAHELRSPLARSSVALELARDALEPEECENGVRPNYGGASPVVAAGSDLMPVREALNRIERETGNLTELIDRLLTISRLESGVQQPEHTEVDLASLVRAVVADADFEARSRSRRVHLTSCEPCLTTGTNALLRSAIENVVRNALRHTPENTAVEVMLSCKSEWLPRWQNAGLHGESFISPLPVSLEHSPLASAVIEVRDAGEGVPVAELGEIFQPFYRAGSGRARERGGAGLGLTITARAIELHGGQFRLCNRKTGGLEVQLRLPVSSTMGEPRL